MSTVFTSPASSSYHPDAHCPALDTGQFVSGKAATETALKLAVALNLAPCLVCAGDPGCSEWQLTRATLGELLELIGPSKPHYGHNPATGRTECDGLTIWPHVGQPRQVARFGDTIRRDGRRYTVTSPTGEPR